MGLAKAITDYLVWLLIAITVSTNSFQLCSVFTGLPTYSQLILQWKVHIRNSKLINGMLILTWRTWLENITLLMMILFLGTDTINMENKGRNETLFTHISHILSFYMNTIIVNIMHISTTNRIHSNVVRYLKQIGPFSDTHVCWIKMNNSDIFIIATEVFKSKMRPGLVRAWSVWTPLQHLYLQPRRYSRLVSSQA